MSDSMRSIALSSVVLPLTTEISDAKVFTGRQKPMTQVDFLFAEIETAHGHSGVGFSYHLRRISQHPAGTDARERHRQP